MKKERDETLNKNIRNLIKYVKGQERKKEIRNN